MSFFENLKVGDDVILNSFGNFSKARVIKITQRNIRVDMGFYSKNEKFYPRSLRFFSRKGLSSNPNFYITDLDINDFEVYRKEEKKKASFLRMKLDLCNEISQLKLNEVNKIILEQIKILLEKKEV